MIDPRTEYILHKEKETTLMLQIERKLAAQERKLAAQKRGTSAEISQSWYASAERWLKEKVFSRRLAENPCAGEEIPC